MKFTEFNFNLLNWKSVIEFLAYKLRDIESFFFAVMKLNFVWTIDSGDLRKNDMGVRKSNAINSKRFFISTKL